MIQIDEKLKPLADDLVRLYSFDVGDKAHPARIVFVARIV
jgi:hypothetical protein